MLQAEIPTQGGDAAKELTAPRQSILQVSPEFQPLQQSDPSRHCALHLRPACGWAAPAFSGFPGSLFLEASDANPAHGQNHLGRVAPASHAITGDSGVPGWISSSFCAPPWIGGCNAV